MSDLYRMDYLEPILSHYGINRHYSLGDEFTTEPGSTVNARLAADMLQAILSRVCLPGSFTRPTEAEQDLLTNVEILRTALSNYRRSADMVLNDAESKLNSEEKLQKALDKAIAEIEELKNKLGETNE